ncbi:hypothetical protein G5B30_07095 [Sphingobacterium sp. SGG-5]|uniref:hypothetical protein n=1 Tax=Sphingobacterium sp. SGG-5 TaxID=2710881 RepID=UPI0013EBEB6A|nr:hypothetical protein [Sphingobacterium sp. SGG-5]NGM61682.1 hypothetical protein [Sphingobacterium sp. SGG-5]
MKKYYMLLLMAMASCSDEQPENIKLEFADQRTELNRQFYATGDLMSVKFRLSFIYKDRRDGEQHSIITYGGQVDNRSDVFTLTEAGDYPAGYYYWLCSHEKDFIADLNVNKISYKISAPHLFEKDYYLDTTIRVFENRRIDFLMDKLAPNNLKSTYLEQVFVGEQKVKARQIHLLDAPMGSSQAPKSYQELQEGGYGSFAGLYGETFIYGDNVIDSIEVRAGNIGIYSDLSVRAVVEDILATYDVTIVSEGPDDTILETEELIFHTRMKGFNIITAITRKP